MESYHEKTNWDGLLSTAMKMHVDHLQGYTDEYKEKVTPRPDWLVVTVDYHS